MEYKAFTLFHGAEDSAASTTSGGSLPMKSGFQVVFDKSHHVILENLEMRARRSSICRFESEDRQ
ncbi:hypothetical protein B9D94_30055 [Paenibacillus sp. Cedars]|nr:hypothetical protein B9D94_30055 [Paenibacillus sp. Cedars]